MHRLWVPETDNPASIRRLRFEVRRIIDTYSFRSWYKLNRRKCPDAPEFGEFWKYLMASLHYDIPGRELCEAIWRATREAFIRFDPRKGNQAKPAHQRFLTHWRFHFRDLVRTTFGKVRKAPAMKPIEYAASRTYMADPFREILLAEVRGLVDQLSGDEQTIIRLHYQDDMSLAEIAKTLHRRKSYVTKLHEDILKSMRRAL